MKLFKSVLVAACAVMIAVGAIVPALPANAQTSASLSIVPKKNYTIEPGKSVNDRLTIRNLDREATLQLNLRIVDFTFTDDGGSPKLFLAEDAPQTTWSLKPYMKVPSSVEIEPGKSATLDMSVSIPAGHGAGSYYSAIVYSTGPPDGGNVGLSASGVTLAFVNIPGDVNEDLTLKKFGAYHEAAPGKEAGYSFFTMTEPRMLAYTLENKGNVTEAPVGSITLTHMFGSEQTIPNINPNNSLALIGQTRTYTACIKLQDVDAVLNGTTLKTVTCADPGLLPGIYTATLNAFYGQNGQNTEELTKTATFIYLPGWFIIVMVIVLAIIAFLIWRLVRKVKGISRSSKANRPTARRRR